MKKRKVWKKAARKNLKQHYLLFVVLCLALAVMGAAFSHSTSAFHTRTPGVEEEQMGIGSGVLAGKDGVDAVARAILDDQLDLGDEIAKQTEEAYQQDSTGVLGRSRGVLAQVVNGVTSGSILVIAAEAILSVFHSQHIMVLLLILISFLLVLVWWVFFRNVALVVAVRMFMEGRTYQQVPIQRALFLWDTRSWGKTARTILYSKVLLFLWSTTIIGGIIKRYSYHLVPYIAAENPGLSPKEAVTLSRKMMNGHKWECLVLELSFIGWGLLGIVTLGFSEILFSNPYRTATMCEYYASLRESAIRQKIEGSELLCDRFLYERANANELEEAYPIENIMEQHKRVTGFRSGLQQFFANVFGIASSDSEEERAWQAAEEAKIRDNRSRAAQEGKIYPTRLSYLAQRQQHNVFSPERTHYIRHYSLSSLILIFFAFSFVGWLWEVSLHLISDGTFVNRGALFGPWIPIYGSGAVLILVLLYFLRRKPLQEFIGTILLCGTVEYFTSVYLEKAHNGTHWWDYTGYFLNLNGRICAEGLLVFGIGGMAIAYLLAPRFDSLIRRMPKKVRILLCVLLVILFAADTIYSSAHPNMGAGITSY